MIFLYCSQAHDTPVRTMVWSHNELWMVTADHAGYVKYWQSNMNNVKMFMAHQDAIRGIRYRRIISCYQHLKISYLARYFFLLHFIRRFLGFCLVFGSLLIWLSQVLRHLLNFWLLFVWLAVDCMNKEPLPPLFLCRFMMIDFYFVCVI